MQYPQLWTGDVTPEHLGTIMKANDEAMAVLSDEGGIFDILAGLYSGGKANIDLFLQGHSSGPVRIDRGSRPQIVMDRPVLTMGLTVQPEVIKNICSNKTFKGRGLIGRFLFVMPKSNIGNRKLNEPPMDSFVASNYEFAIRNIINQSHSTKGVKETHTLQFTQEAFKKWKDYEKTIETLMNDEIGYLSQITDWAGKLLGMIADIH